MDVHAEPSALTTEAGQATPELATAMLYSTVDTSPFEGLVDKPLDPVGAPSHLSVMIFAQHVVSISRRFP